jgi:hypothetical protein
VDAEAARLPGRLRARAAGTGVGWLEVAVGSTPAYPSIR